MKPKIIKRFNCGIFFTKNLANNGGYDVGYDMKIHSFNSDTTCFYKKHYFTKKTHLTAGLLLACVIIILHVVLYFIS